MSANSNSDEEPLILGIPYRTKHVLDPSARADLIVEPAASGYSHPVTDGVSASKNPPPIMSEPDTQQTPLRPVEQMQTGLSESVTSAQELGSTTPKSEKQNIPLNAIPDSLADNSSRQWRHGRVAAVPDQDRTLGVPHREPKRLKVEDGEKDLFDEPLGTGETLATLNDDRPSADDTKLLFQAADPIILALLICGSGALLLFLAIQLLFTINILATWSTVAQWFGYIGIGLITASVVAAMGYLIHRYLRLRQSPLISLAMLENLHGRHDMQHAALQKTADAQQQLESFLRDYPLDNRRSLLRLGFTDESNIRDLQNQRDRLCQGPRGSDMMWLDELDRQFLSVLDEVSIRRIKRYARQVGIKTAFAPTGFVDAAIVSINAYLLIGDLCQIYNVRANRWSTLMILLHMFVNTVSAAEMEDLTDAMSDGLAGAVRDHIGEAATFATQFVGKRIAEGVANGVLLSRLGHVTMRSVRPIRQEKRAS
jgi:putative membrane protein